MDDEPRPAWASQAKALQIKDEKVQIIGFQEVDASAKISSAFRLSDNSARVELSKLVETQFSTIFQNLEEGLEDLGGLTRNYSSEVSKNVLRDLQITQRYWEKVETFNSQGEKTYRLRIYSLAEISESKLKKLIRDTLKKEAVPKEIKKQILDQFEAEIKQFQSF